MELLTVREIAAWCGGKIFGNAQAEVEKIVRDSREAGKGTMFAAIRGERLDGHSFISAVLKNGTTAVLSSEGPETAAPDGIPEGSALILVTDTVRALGAIARGYKRRFTAGDHPLKTVGVTGSVGKTSCKDMIAAALSGGLRTVKTQANFNNHIGVPLTLLQLSSSTQAAVVEMGMNHFGEIDYAASIAEPDMGVITNVGTAHIENLGSREGIRKAKLEIVPHLSEGPLLINGDDDMLRAVKDTLGIPVETFGFGRENDGVILQADATEDAREHVVLSYRGETYDFILNTMGRHMAYNAIPAVMTAVRFGLSKEEILKGFASYRPTPHRLQRIVTEDYLIIDDTYNANPVSMKAAVDALTAIPGSARRVAVLGDMFELGDYSAEGHFEVGQHLVQKGGVNVLVTVGTEAEAIERGAMSEAAVSGSAAPLCRHFEDKDAFLKNALSILHENDIILLKASHGMAFSDIPEKLEKLL